MITSAKLKVLGIRSIEAYFELIVNAHINGQMRDVGDYIDKLDKKQRAAFYLWLNTTKILSPERLSDMVVKIIMASKR